MRLSRLVKELLIRIQPKHAHFVEERSTSVVMLDTTFYGCVEAVALWHTNLCATMRSNGFVPNPYTYDPCVFNKQGSDGTHVTMLTHVNDLLITRKIIDNHASFEKCMRNKLNTRSSRSILKRRWTT